MKPSPRLVLSGALLAALLGSSILRAADAPAALAADPESPAAKAARLEWFRHDKFGLFIHWGLYSIPAGYWKGQRSPGIGEWVMHRMKIPVAEFFVASALVIGGLDFSVHLAAVGSMVCRKRSAPSFTRGMPAR